MDAALATIFGLSLDRVTGPTQRLMISRVPEIGIVRASDRLDMVNALGGRDFADCEATPAERIFAAELLRVVPPAATVATLCGGLTTTPAHSGEG